MQESLADFIPTGADVRINEHLQPTVQNLRTLLPAEEIFRLFTSSPTETNGISVFPYYRPDKGLQVVQDFLFFMTKYPVLREDRLSKDLENYLLSSGSAFKSLLWIEAGFGGLENFARSPDSINWGYGTEISGMGDPAHSAKIIAAGKKLYRPTLKEFNDFRTNLYANRHTMPPDLFVQYPVAAKLLHNFARSL